MQLRRLVTQCAFWAHVEWKTFFFSSQRLCFFKVRLPGKMPLAPRYSAPLANKWRVTVNPHWQLNGLESPGRHFSTCSTWGGKIQPECEWYHLGTGNRAQIKGERALSTDTHLSLHPDCGGHVTSRLPLLLLWIPCRDVLHSLTVSPSLHKLFLLWYFC